MSSKTINDAMYGVYDNPSSTPVDTPRGEPNNCGVRASNANIPAMSAAGTVQFNAFGYTAP